VEKYQHPHWENKINVCKRVIDEEGILRFVLYAVVETNFSNNTWSRRNVEDQNHKRLQRILDRQAEVYNQVGQC
jgi:hypothetical protein